jgi:hypothetical protein
MLIAIIGIGLAIVFFYAMYLGFKQGLRLGMQSSKQIIPPPIRNPIQAFTDIVDGVKAKKEANDIQDEINLMQRYTGDKIREEE